MSFAWELTSAQVREKVYECWTLMRGNGIDVFADATGGHWVMTRETFDAVARVTAEVTYSLQGSVVRGKMIVHRDGPATTSTGTDMTLFGLPVHLDQTVEHGKFVLRYEVSV